MLALLSIVTSFVMFGQLELRSFEHLSVDKGLSSGKTNNYIFKDSYGYVWISSDVGLNRYDGHRISHYHQKTKTDRSLAREVASQSNIFEDLNGDLWFAGGSAVTRYDRRNDWFDNFHLLDEEGERVVLRYKWAYMGGDQEYLLFGAQSELYYLSINSPNEPIFIDSTRMGYKDYMNKQSDDEYLLIQFRPGRKVLTLKYISLAKGVVSVQEKRLGEKVFDVVQMRQSDTLLVGTESGVKLLDINSNELISASEELSGFKHKVVELEVYNDQLIVGTENEGVFLFSMTSNKACELIHTINDGMIEPFVQDVSRMYLDEDANLFISTQDNGVFHCSLSSVKMRTYLYESGKPVKDIGVLDDTTFLVLYEDVLEVVYPSMTKFYSLHFAGIEIDQPTFVSADEYGRVYIGTFDKLYYANQNEFNNWNEIHLSPSEPNTLGPGYNDMLTLPGGNMLFALNVERPVVVDSSFKNTKWLTPNVIRPRGFATNNDGLVLVASYADTLHLLRYDAAVDSTAEVLSYYTELPSVNDLYFDEVRNSFWVGTMNGFYEINVSVTSFTRYEIIKDALVGDRPVFSVVGANGGVELILGSSDGIYRYNLNERKLEVYTASDGIQGYEFVAHSSAIMKSSNKLIIGGVNGANVFSLSQDFNRGYPPLIQLTAVYSNDVKIETDKLKDLSYRQNNIKFEFRDGDFADPSNVKYSYWLVIDDKDSTYQASNVSTSEFRSLAPNNYELVVLSTNSDGLTTDTPLVIPFTILPPWYRTWWAYTGYALTIFGIAFTIFWLYLMRIREKEKGQVRAAKYQTEVAQAQARAAKTETSVLRLQMNPHFIFNSLNAVNAFLWKGNKLEANEYLARFALLMRETLNRSTQTLSRLEDTIHSLENYLGTEQMRLGDRMSYKFEVDDTLDTFSVYFPTMMLQPFVENAIWHGISGLEGEGLITIRFRPDRGREVLVAEVEDNGRGRQQAAKRNTGHASKSLSITQRRLDLLNMALNTASKTSDAPARRRPEKDEDDPAIEVSFHPVAEMKIIDLLQTDGSAGGTLVRLTLPLKYPKTYARDNS